MTSPRDEALTLLRRAREELEGVSAFVNGWAALAAKRPHPLSPRQVADEQMDVWARVQQATNVVEKLMSEISTLASYEFAATADVRKVSYRAAQARRADIQKVLELGRTFPPHTVTITTPEENA